MNNFFYTKVGTNPCFNCEKREPTCHGTCQAYLKWKAINAKIIQEAKKKAVSYY